MATGQKQWASNVVTPEARTNFAQNAPQFLRNHSFDGIDLDWEFPPEELKENFVLFLKEIREQFDVSEKESENKLLLTVATSAITRQINKSYDVPKLSQYVHFNNQITD